MIPVRVYVKNFMSYRQGQELLFDSAPLWVLAGENGAGKSTIFDAITFALYNCHRAGKQNHKDLINHQEDSLAVEFDFLINNSQYRIRRTVSRRSVAARQISEIIDNKIRPISNTDNEQGFKEWIEHHIGLNENAFTSCILLTQGNSDKLLTATPSERFTILKQVIDLSDYERLYEQADNLRREAEGELKGLEKQLENISPISNEQLQAAQECLNQAKNNYQIIQAQVEKLIQLIPQAKQWEHLQKQIEQEQTKKQELQQLIDHSEEITTNFNRLEELKLDIPKLQTIITAKERLANTAKEINKIEQDLQQVLDNLTQAETEQKESQEQCDRLQESFEILQTNLQQVTNKLSKIAPLITKLEQYEQIKTNLEQCDREITKLPSDLSQQVDNQEKHYQQLVDIKNTLPWLENIADSRLSLNDAIEQQQITEENVRLLNFELVENQQLEQQISIDVKKLEQAEGDLSTKLKLEQANYERVQKQLQSFEQAATKPTCELCGQEITPEHAQKEKERLNQNLANIQAGLNNLQQKYSTAQEKSSKYQTRLKNIENTIKDTAKNINNNERIQQHTQVNIQTLLQQLDRNWNNLPKSDRDKIYPHKPNNESQWLNTQYPKNSDLEHLEQQVNTIEIQKQSLDNLKKQYEQWQQLNNQHQIYQNQLVKIEANVSITEAQKARSQYLELQESQKEINNSIQSRQKKLKELKENKNNVAANVRSYSERAQQLQLELKGKQTSYSEIQDSLQVKLNELPEQWQEKNLFNSDRLQQLQQESDRLIKYKELKKQLDNAQQALDYCIQQVNNCQKQIEQLPIEAHRLSTEVEAELLAAKEKRDNCDCAKTELQRQFNELEKTQQERKKV